MSGRSLLLNFSQVISVEEDGSVRLKTVPAFSAADEKKKRDKGSIYGIPVYLYAEGNDFIREIWSMRFSTYCPFFEYITFALIPLIFPKLPGKRADPVGRSVYDNADDVHMFLFIWKSHSSDNIGL